MALQQTIRYQICAAIVLSVVLMAQGAYIRRQNPLATQLALDELLATGSDNEQHALLNQLQKFQRQQSNFVAKWPALRDLLLTADYDDNNALESEDTTNARFVNRLHQLAASTATDIDDEREYDVAAAAAAVAAAEAAQTNNNDNNSNSINNNNNNNKKFPQSVAGPKMSFKDHGTKKNVQYMSPCHFKICNMGRKRNARWYFGNYAF